MAMLTCCANLNLIFYLPGGAGGIVRSNTLFVVTFFPNRLQPRRVLTQFLTGEWNAVARPGSPSSGCRVPQATKFLVMVTLG